MTDYTATITLGLTQLQELLEWVNTTDVELSNTLQRQLAATQITVPDAATPLEQVKRTVDAVVDADWHVTDCIEQRRQAIIAAVEAGYTQQAIADYIGMSQPRVAQMLHMPTRVRSMLDD